MFGYVNINQQSLSDESYQTYHSVYCGLCENLKRGHGQRARLTLNYDMTFLVLFLTALYEPESRQEEVFCPLHPTRKKRTLQNEFTVYGSDMNVLLSYQTLMDGWKDDKSTAKRFLAEGLKKKYEELLLRYPRQGKALTEYVEALEKAEEEGSTDIDRVSGLTGRMLAELFVYREDHWQEEVRRMAFYLGKFIYLMDACEDLEKDRKSGSYNIFLVRSYESEAAREQEMETVLRSMMSQCARAFERLPIVEYTDILRNVLYSGVWTRYELRKKKQEEKEQVHEKSL